MSLLTMAFLVAAQGADPLQQESNESLIKALLKESGPSAEHARGILSRRGPGLIALLLSARKEGGLLGKRTALDTLIFEGKEGIPRTGEAKSVFEKLRRPIGEVPPEDRKAQGLLEHIRTKCALNVEIDPVATLAKTDFEGDPSALPVWKVLDQLCAASDLDYDFRFGLVFVSTRTRLWRIPAPELNQEQIQRVAKALAELDVDDIEARRRAGALLLGKGEAAIPILEEGTVSKSKEVGGRCTALLARMQELTYLAGTLPLGCTARSQAADGRSAELLKLLNRPIDFHFDHLSPTGLSGALEGVLALKCEDAPAKTEFEASVNDLPVLDLLEVLLLPRGMDFRIVDQSVVSFVPRR
jgi:hypothetical protein